MKLIKGSGQKNIVRHLRFTAKQSELLNKIAEVLDIKDNYLVAELIENYAKDIEFYLKIKQLLLNDKYNMIMLEKNGPQLSRVKKNEEHPMKFLIGGSYIRQDRVIFRKTNIGILGYLTTDSDEDFYEDTNNENINEECLGDLIIIDLKNLENELLDFLNKWEISAEYWRIFILENSDKIPIELETSSEIFSTV